MLGTVAVSSTLLLLLMAQSALAAPREYAEEVTSDAPSLYYCFDEASGNARNLGSLGSDYDLVPDGTIARQVPSRGPDSAVRFDAAEDFMESLASAPAEFQGNPSFSVEAIYFVPRNGFARDWAPLLSWGSNATGQSVFFSFSDNDADEIYAGFYNGGLQTPAGETSVVPLGEWHHVIWTREGGGTAQEGTRLYVNGVEVTDLLEPDPALCCEEATPQVTAGSFRVNRAGDSTRFATVTLDELALYDRVLGAGEVQEHHEAFTREWSIAPAMGPAIEAETGITCDTIGVLFAPAPLLASSSDGQHALAMVPCGRGFPPQFGDIVVGLLDGRTGELLDAQGFSQASGDVQNVSDVVALRAQEGWTDSVALVASQNASDFIHQIDVTSGTLNMTSLAVPHGTPFSCDGTQVLSLQPKAAPTEGGLLQVGLTATAVIVVERTDSDANDSLDSCRVLLDAEPLGFTSIENLQTDLSGRPGVILSTDLPAMIRQEAWLLDPNERQFGTGDSIDGGGEVGFLGSLDLEGDCVRARHTPSTPSPDEIIEMCPEDTQPRIVEVATGDIGVLGGANDAFSGSDSLDEAYTYSTFNSVWAARSPAIRVSGPGDQFDGNTIVFVQASAQPSTRNLIGLLLDLANDPFVGTHLAVRNCVHSDGDALCDADDPCDSFTNTLPFADANNDGVPNECQCGDPNGTGAYESDDLLITFNCLQTDQPATGVCSETIIKGDANGTGAFESDDLLAIFGALGNPALGPGLTCAARPEGTNP